MVSAPEPRSAHEETPLTQHVGGLCFAIMMVEKTYRLGVCVGQVGNRDVRWFELADEGIRADVWRMMGRHVEVWSRDGIAHRVEMP